MLTRLIHFRLRSSLRAIQRPVKAIGVNEQLWRAVSERASYPLPGNSYPRTCTLNVQQLRSEGGEKNTFGLKWQLQYCQSWVFFFFWMICRTDHGSYCMEFRVSWGEGGQGYDRLSRQPCNCSTKTRFFLRSKNKKIRGKKKTGTGLKHYNHSLRAL